MTSVSLSWTLLLVALSIMTKRFASTHGAPCHNDTRGSLKEIQKQLGQLQLEVKILKENKRARISRNCAELYKSAMRVSGVYTIDPDGSGAFDVYCDQTTSDGGWTVFQRRLDGSVDFNRTWNEYKYGFGNYLKGEFWLGFDKIRRLTRNETKNRLRVDLGVAPSKAVHAEYEWFGLGEEKDKYRLSLGNLSEGSTINDSLHPHMGLSFNTWDKNDCASSDRINIGGGWWYMSKKSCSFASNLNGVYRGDGRGKFHWGFLVPDEPELTTPQTSEMKIRPVDYS